MIELRSNAWRRVSRGFGIIEIMVALALGAILLLGITEVFTNNSRTRAEIERTGRQIESGAYALRVLEEDIASAGFWGEAGAQPASPTLPPVCPGLGADTGVAKTELSEAMGYPVQGEDTLGTNCISPKAGTEFLAVRRVSSCALGDTDCDPAGGNFHLQVQACFDPDDVTVPAPGTIKIDEDISQLDLQPRLALCSPGDAPFAPRYRFLSRVYFVNDDDQLVRAELTGSGAADYEETLLVDGVEMLRFEYGQDTSGDGQVDDPNEPVGVDWADVTMVRPSLIVRNLQPTPGFSDGKTYSFDGISYTPTTALQGYKRQLYSRTISLRNVAGRRERH